MAGKTPITFEVNQARLNKTMRLFPSVLKIQLGDAFDHIGRHFLKEFKKERLSGRPGINWSYKFFKRFRRATLTPVSGGIENMGVHIFADSKIAAMHEQGGRVSAEGGGRLAVPLSSRTEMYTGTGRLRKRYKSPAKIKNLVPIRLNAKTFLAKVKKKTNEVTPLYVLKKSIMLKPRLGFIKTWDGQNNWRLKRIDRAVNRTLKAI